MAGKKQIKQLVVKTSSPGSKEVNKELQTLETALQKAKEASGEVNKQFDKTVNTFLTLEIAINGVEKSIKKMNNTLNGATKTASKRIGAYADNIEILTLYMKDLGDESNKVSRNLKNMGTNVASREMSELRNFVESIEDEMMRLNTSITELNGTMIRNTRYTREVRNNLGDLFITSERTEESLGDLANTSNRATSSHRRHSEAAGKLANDTRRLGGAGSQNARAFSDLAFRMNPLVSLYATIAVNVYALTEAFRLLNEASGLNRLREQSAQFAANMSGIDIQRLSKDLQELSGYALSAGEALRQSVRGVSYGFTADEMERLTEGARKASVALGVTFTDAIDRVFRGISKGEVEILDEIGVVTRLDTAYKKYAATLNKRSDDLTEVERRTALATEVMSQLEERFSSFTTQATGLERVGVALKGLVDNTLILASTSIDSYARQLADLIDGFRGVQSSSTDVANAKDVMDKALASGNIAQATVASYEYKDALESLRNESIEGTKEYEAYQKSVEASQTAQTILNRTLTVGTIYMAGYAAILAGKAIAAVAGFTVALVTKTAAAVSAATVTASQTAAYVLQTGVLGAASVAMSIYTGATVLAANATLLLLKRVALLLLPIALVAIKITAIITLIGAMAYAVADFANFLTGGAVFKAIGEFFDYIGEKLEQFLGWLGKKTKEVAEGSKEFVGSSLDSISKAFGLNELTAGLTETNKQIEITEKTINAYKNSMLSLASNPGAIRYALTGGLTREEAENQIRYLNNAGKAMQQLGTDINNLNPPSTEFEKFSSTLRSITELPLKLEVNAQGFEDARVRFEKLKDDGIIPLEIEWNGGAGFAEFQKRVDEAGAKIKYFSEQASTDLKVFSNSIATGDASADIQAITRELEQVNSVISANAKLGKEVNKEQREELERTKQVLESEREKLRLNLEYSRANDALKMSQEDQLFYLRQSNDVESQILQVKMSQIRAQISLAKSKNQDTYALEQQLKALNMQFNQERSLEAVENRRFMIEQRRAELEKAANYAGNARQEAAIRAEILKTRQEEINLMAKGMERQKAQAELDRDIKANTGAKDGAGFKDLGSVLSSISGMDGLSELQTTAATSLSSVSNVYSSFLQQMEGQSGSFIDFLKNDIEAFGQVAQAGLQFAQQVFAQASEAKVDALQREIEAEKKRDGQSEASKKKIKRLQAEQIREEAKAKKASVVMSTAAAIMQAMAQVPYPANIAVAAGAGIMGALQLAQVDKAASGQISALNSGASNMSMSGGSRTDQVDVTRNANAGELSYLRGESGTGNIGNFNPGRAGGNFASAGTSITVGESGPEEITPAMPVNVSSAGDSGNGGSVTFSPQYNLQAIDAEGMEDLLVRHSQSLYEGLERELQGRNKTLESL